MLIKKLKNPIKKYIYKAYYMLDTVFLYSVETQTGKNMIYVYIYKSKLNRKNNEEIKQ